MCHAILQEKIQKQFSSFRETMLCPIDGKLKLHESSTGRARLIQTRLIRSST